jgi:methionyl-tRNA formyltransferase
MINGDAEAGYSFHLIDAGCDTGNLLIQEDVPILAFDTQQTLYNRVMFAAMEEFPKAFDMCLSGELGVKQVGKGSFHKRGCPYDGRIDPKWNDAQIERFIRAMISPPLPCAVFMGQEVRTMEDYYRLKDA